MRLASFNIRYGEGNYLDTTRVEGGSLAPSWRQPGDGYGPGATGLSPLAVAVRDLGQYRPDIVIVQEADANQLRSGGVDQLATIGAGLGLEYRASQAFYRGQHWGLRLPAKSAPSPAPGPSRLGEFGIGLVSRWPLADIRPLRLGAALPRLWRGGKFDPYPGFNRVALAATIATPAGPVTIANTHLETVPEVARIQLARAWRHALRPGLPTVLGGDFNLEAQTVAQLAQQWPLPPALARTVAVHSLPSFPVGQPQRAIDSLLTARVGVRRLATLSTPVSDHCVLIADLEF